MKPPFKSRSWGWHYVDGSAGAKPGFGPSQQPWRLTEHCHRYWEFRGPPSKMGSQPVPKLICSYQTKPYPTIPAPGAWCHDVTSRFSTEEGDSLGHFACPVLTLWREPPQEKEQDSQSHQCHLLLIGRSEKGGSLLALSTRVWYKAAANTAVAGMKPCGDLWWLYLPSWVLCRGCQPFKSLTLFEVWDITHSLGISSNSLPPWVYWSGLRVPEDLGHRELWCAHQDLQKCMAAMTTRGLAQVIMDPCIRQGIHTT